MTVGTPCCCTAAELLACIACSGCTWLVAEVKESWCDAAVATELRHDWWLLLLLLHRCLLPGAKQGLYCMCLAATQPYDRTGKQEDRPRGTQEPLALHVASLIGFITVSLLRSNGRGAVGRLRKVFKKPTSSQAHKPSSCERRRVPTLQQGPGCVLNASVAEMLLECCCTKQCRQEPEAYLSCCVSS